MPETRTFRWTVIAAGAALLLLLVAACTREVQVPGETVVVEKEVVKTVEVPGETVVVEKVVTETVEVPGETITKEVVKDRPWYPARQWWWRKRSSRPSRSLVRPSP